MSCGSGRFYVSSCGVWPQAGGEMSDQSQFEDFEVRHLPDARRTEWLRANAE